MRYYRRKDYQESIVDNFVDLPTNVNMGEVWLVRNDEAEYMFTSDGGGPGTPGWEKLADTSGSTGIKAQYLSIGGVLSAFSGGPRWYPAGNITLQDAQGSVNVAPTGADIIFDIYLNGGASIFAAPIHIVAGAFLSGIVVPTTTAFTDTDYLTPALIQVGSTIAGEDFSARLRFS